MKKSINTRLFVIMSLLILVIIMFIWILNSLVLKQYYMYEKTNFLVTVYNTVNSYYTNAEDTSTFEAELEDFEVNGNIDIVIRNGANITVYSTSKDFLRNSLFGETPGREYPLDPATIASKLTDNKNYSIEVFSDNKMETDFVVLYGILDNDCLVFIRTPMESITESVNISNKFLIFIGAICVLISSLVAYYLSSSFTEPIKKLNKIAKNMTSLDFSEKYQINSSDEIGTLGESINQLSTNLEKTINELKEANIDLERDVEKKSKLNEMRSQFISDVSHELKTPIALIQGYAEGLVDGVVTEPEDMKYYCEVILDEANKMKELTKDLLDLTSLEYGETKLQIESFDITTVLKNTLKKNELLFSENNINVEFNEEKEIQVLGDVFRIEQVITNYISNAIKHVDDNKKIKIYLEDLEGKIRINVFNSGPHVSDEDLPRLWNKFYKIDTSRNRESGGTGIGLSVVKAIMEKHNCNFGATNSDGGIIFWFELNKNLR